MLKLDTIGKRITFGFLLLTLILAFSVLFSLSKVSENGKVSQTVYELRQPIVKNALLVLNGVNQSISSFRGWLLFRQETSKESRQDAWKDIETAKTVLHDLWVGADNALAEQKWNNLNERLEKLHQLQNGLEANDRLSDGDTEKIKTTLVPLGREIRNILEEIIAEQETLLQAEVKAVSVSTQNLIYLEWILFAIGIFISGLVSFLITRQTTQPIGQAVVAAQQLAEENFDFEVNLKGFKEMEIFGASLEKMRTGLKQLTEGLRKSNAELETQRWLIEGQIGLLENMAGDLTISQLANNSLKYICNRIEASVGAFYLNESGTLSSVGAYANQKSDLQLAKKFTFQEGLVGQAAIGNKILEVQKIPENYIKVSSGLGEAVPQSLVLLPIVFNSKTSAVIELGLLRSLTKTEKDFLEAAAPNVAIAVNLGTSTQKTKELLEETQAQAEELQTQQEELKAFNEELEAKTEALEASEEVLKNQQEQLRVTNEELEEQTQLLEREKEALGQRTNELEHTKTRLEARAKEVEQVSRYKTDFLANMSHELRTPLNSILMLSQSLTENRTGNLSDRQLGAVKTIHSSGSDLLTLIEDILDLSKVEAGKLDVKPESVTVQELCDIMRSYFEPMAKEGQLEFHIQIEKNISPTMTTDPTRLKQVLKNLLSNAFKFTNTGSVTLSIYRPIIGYKDFKLARAGSSSICFSVKDTGIGIPQDKIPVVFEAFKQLDAKTTRKYGGTGLGLSIVRELVSLLGGELKMESAEGAGTTVTVCLPEVLVLSDKGQETRPAVTEKTERHRPRLVLQETAISDDRESVAGADSVVLIVEDDLRFANSILDLCRDNGFKGIILNDGVSAVKLAEEIVPQGILLDLSLPELDGTDVIRLLKENPKTRHIPIQVITGHDRRQEVLKEGAIGFAKKPVQKDELLEMVLRIRNFAGEEKRLLIVEDDPAQRRAIREYVEVPGVTVIEAETGGSGLELLAKSEISCVILDLKLPDMDGQEFLRRSKELCGDSAPPVIIYTGKDLSDSEIKDLERNSKSIIVKGVKSPDRLFDETMMFLHRLQKDLPTEKRKIVETLHDPTRILKGKTILVVDDDPRNIQSLSHLLEDHGVRVYDAENGMTALKWLEDGGRPDIILMDMMMPEMDGYEATRRIRQQPKLKGIPVVALTARAMKGEREKCLQAGCDDYLSKPIENDKLVSLLRVWLYRSA